MTEEIRAESGSRASALIITGLLVGFVAWDLGLGVLLPQVGVTSEIGLLGIDKIGFALLLAVALASAHLWGACGFLGGLQPRRWTLVWPLWLATAVSVAQGIGVTSVPEFLAWGAIAFAVAFGEEGVFRGIIAAVLDPSRPRRVAMITAILFALVHLGGLISLDPRMILAQATAALGLGLILGSARLLTGSIWPGLVAHAALDFFGIVAAGGRGQRACLHAPGRDLSAGGGGRVARLGGIAAAATAGHALNAVSLPATATKTGPPVFARY